LSESPRFPDACGSHKYYYRNLITYHCLQLPARSQLYQPLLYLSATCHTFAKACPALVRLILHFCWWNWMADQHVNLNLILGLTHFDRTIIHYTQPVLSDLHSSIVTGCQGFGLVLINHHLRATRIPFIHVIEPGLQKSNNRPSLTWHSGRILERCALNVETTSIRVMAAVVTCQNNSCLNGYPPSRLECPTCNKYVPIAGAQKFFLDESYQAWHSRFFLLRPRMLQVGM